MHSPFVFDLIRNVLNDKTSYPCYHHLEQLRQVLQKEKYNLSDDGDFLSSSLKPYNQLIYRLAQYHQAKQIYILAPRPDMTVFYLASLQPEKIWIEPPLHSRLLEQASVLLEDAVAARLIRSSQAEGLSSCDFIYLQNVFPYEEMRHHIDRILPFCSEKTVIAMAPLHQHPDSERIWDYLRHEPSVTISIDLFHIGLVYFRKEKRTREHFAVRF